MGHALVGYSNGDIIEEDHGNGGCLCKIHNFYIHHNDIVLHVTCLDQLNIESQIRGRIAVVEREHTEAQRIPEQLIGGGHHFQDVARPDQQRIDTTLPRNILATEVEALGLCSPTEITRRH